MRAIVGVGVLRGGACLGLADAVGVERRLEADREGHVRPQQRHAKELDARLARHVRHDDALREAQHRRAQSLGRRLCRGGVGLGRPRVFTRAVLGGGRRRVLQRGVGGDDGLVGGGDLGVVLFALFEKVQRHAASLRRLVRVGRWAGNELSAHVAALRRAPERDDGRARGVGAALARVRGRRAGRALQGLEHGRVERLNVELRREGGVKSVLLVRRPARRGLGRRGRRGLERRRLLGRDRLVEVREAVHLLRLGFLARHVREQVGADVFDRVGWLRDDERGQRHLQRLAHRALEVVRIHRAHAADGRPRRDES
mmetsp:Transcript_25634/g.86149  ORF Transcript_25634/g.86149 Transcript_25634/m.86149 type:complete len:313 (-) Transcript_25634:24-962(-)